MDRAPLPDLNSLGREALLALIRAQEEEFAAQDAEIQRLEAELDADRQTLSEQADELHSRSERIDHLKLMVEKSEKIVIQLEQLELQLEEEETTQAEAEAAVERVSPAREPKPRTVRKPLPEHLRREVVTHAPDGHCCPDCGSQLRQFGEDVSEQLEYIPESFKVIRHVRPKFCCTGCDRVVEAAAPSRPIERGLAGPSLLAHVIVSKYADHLPLYRQSEIYGRQGVEIPRSTLADWVGAASDLLSPLVDAIRKHVLAGRKLHADDRPAAARPRQGACGRTCVTTGRGRRDASSGLVRLLGRSQGRASAPTSEDIQGRSTGGRVRRVSSSVRRWCLRSCLLGARQAQVPRDPCHPRLAHNHRSVGQDRSSLRHRRRDPRQAGRSQTECSPGASQAAA